MAYINWTLLTSLAVGSMAAVIVARLATEATRGFLAFTAFCATVFGVLAVLSDAALPSAVGLPVLGQRANVAFDMPRRLLLSGFTVLGFAYTLALVGGRRAPQLGLAALGSGALCLVVAALGWSGFPDGIPLAVQLGVLSLATGGVFAAMILGHWYLVTPHLPEAPLILLTRLLTAVVAVQVALFVAWLTAGLGSGHSPIEPLFGDWAIFVWLRLLVGLVFPLAISWAALQTARTRSMESATGLLYIDVGSIAAGTILAAGLYFAAGLLV